MWSKSEARATVCVVGEAIPSSDMCFLLHCPPKLMASKSLLPRTPLHKFNNVGVMTRLWLHVLAIIVESIRTVLDTCVECLDFPVVIIMMVHRLA